MADLGHTASLHLAEGLCENRDIANKCFSFFKSLSVLISTDSDSALALVIKKSKNMTREESQSPPL